MSYGKKIGVGIAVVLIIIGLVYGMLNTPQLIELETTVTDGTSTNTVWLTESDGSSTCYKIAGVHGGYDADCVSAEEIYVGGVLGDGTGGYTTFVYDTGDPIPTCNSVNPDSNRTHFHAGLSNSDDSASYTDIDFAWMPREGKIFENGNDIGIKGTINPEVDTTYKVSIAGDGTITYYENDILKYTSSKTATAGATYQFDSSLIEISTTICNITVVENSG